MNESAEEIFSRYSYPCAGDLLNLKLITQEDYDLLEKYHKEGKIPSKEEFEKLFPNALERVERLADSIGKDKWDYDVIKKYFLEEHNKVIDREEGLYEGAHHTIKELCKVRVGEIVKKEIVGNNTLYSVNYGNEEEKIVGNYLPDANVGDNVSTHWKFAIEKVSEEDFERYGGNNNEKN